MIPGILNPNQRLDRAIGLRGPQKFGDPFKPATYSLSPIPLNPQPRIGFADEVIVSYSRKHSIYRL